MTPASRSLARVGAVVAVLVCTIAVADRASAQAPSPAPTSVSLESIMTGAGNGVSAIATSAPAGTSAFVVDLVVDNTTSGAVSLAVPYGTMFVPADEAEQTVVTAGPYQDDSFAALARDGAVPTFVAAPGTSRFRVQAFCGEKHDSSPMGFTRVAYGGVAADPLPGVLRNIAIQRPADEDGAAAVWWVTDLLEVPGPNRGVDALLAGIDTTAFAAHPVDVVPDLVAKFAPGDDGSAVELPPLASERLPDGGRSGLPAGAAGVAAETSDTKDGSFNGTVLVVELAVVGLIGLVTTGFVLRRRH